MRAELRFWVLLLPIAFASPALAQGFAGADFSVGTGKVRSHCSNCTGIQPSPFAGLSLAVSARLRIAHHLQVAAIGMSNHGVKGQEARTLNFAGAFFGAVPPALDHLLLYGGVGYQWYKHDFKSISAREEADSPAMLAGVEYQIRLLRQLAISPYLDVVFAFRSQATLNDRPSVSVAPRLLHAGLRLGVAP